MVCLHLNAGAHGRQRYARARRKRADSAAVARERGFEGLVRRVAEQPEARLVDLRVVVERLGRGFDRDGGGQLERVAVDAGGDRGEGDLCVAVLRGQLDRSPVA
jgi:hypothetical protein